MVFDLLLKNAKSVTTVPGLPYQRQTKKSACLGYLWEVVQMSCGYSLGLTALCVLERTTVQHRHSKHCTYHRSIQHVAMSTSHCL